MVAKANVTAWSFFTMRNTVKILPMTTVQLAIAVNALPEVMEIAA